MPGISEIKDAVSMLTSWGSKVAGSVGWGASRNENALDYSARTYDLTRRIIEAAKVSQPGVDDQLISDVVDLTRNIKIKQPEWLDSEFRGRVPRIMEQYRKLPLIGAIDVASLGLDRKSISKAGSIVAQIIHPRIADGSITSDQLRTTLEKAFQRRGEPANVVERGKIQDEIEDIMRVTEECARIRHHSYDAKDTFIDAMHLIQKLEAGEGQSAEYQTRKSQYEADKKRVLDLCLGGESFILFSAHPAGTMFARVIDTQQEISFLSSLKPRGGSRARRYLRLAAQNAAWMYVPMLERFGWYGPREGLGKLVMEALQPGKYDEIKKILEARDQNSVAGLKQRVTNIADAAQKDPVLADIRENYGIDINFSSREKSVFASWLKIIKDSLFYDEPLRVEKLHDLTGMRFIAEQVRPAKVALGMEARRVIEEKASEACQRMAEIIKEQATIIKDWRPGDPMPVAQGEIAVWQDKDYISAPKKNGYQSRQFRILLHDPQQRGVAACAEVQFRTRVMDDNANFGSAFHGDHSLDRAAPAEAMAKHTAHEVTAPTALEKWRIAMHVNSKRARQAARSDAAATTYATISVKPPKGAEIIFTAPLDESRSFSVGDLLDMASVKARLGKNFAQQNIRSIETSAGIFDPLPENFAHKVGNQQHVDVVIPATIGRRTMPTAVELARFDARLRLMNHVTGRLEEGASTFTDAQSSLIALRTPLGTNINLPTQTPDGRELRILDAIYLMSRHIGAKYLFDNLKGIKVNGVEQEMTLERLRRPLQNAELVEITAGQGPIRSNDWAQPLQTMSDQKLDAYASLKGTRKAVRGSVAPESGPERIYGPQTPINRGHEPR